MKMKKGALLCLLMFAAVSLFAADVVNSVSGPTKLIVGQSYQVTVQYEADTDRKVSVYLFNTSNWSMHGSSATTVGAGTGNVTLEVTVGTASVGTDYQWTAKVEDLSGTQLNQKSSWCEVVNTPVSTEVTIDADFLSPTGNLINRRVFGLNAFKAFDPTVTQNAKYQSNMAAMNPGHIRYHSWEMVQVGHNNAWVDENGDWMASKVAAAMEGALWRFAEQPRYV